MNPKFDRLNMAWNWLNIGTRWRPIGIGVVLCSLILMLYALVSNASRIDFAALQLDIGALVMAVLLTSIAVWIGGLAWWQIVCTLVPNIAFTQAIKTYMVSVLIKYLPGPGWQQISRTAHLSLAGPSLRRSLVPVAWDLVLVMSTGMALAITLAAITPRNILALIIPQTSLLFISLLLWGFCLFLLMMVARGSYMNFAREARRSIFQRLLFCEVFYLTSWLVFGTGLWFTCRAIIPISIVNLPDCIIALILSVEVGIAVIFVPNGYGIREIVMSSILHFFVPAPINVVISIMSRFILISSEFLSSGVTVLVPYMLSRHRRA